MKKWSLFVIVIVIGAFLLTAISCHKDRNKDLGMVDNPIKIAFMPSGEKGMMDKNAKIIADGLATSSGLKVESFVASDFVTIIDGLASKRFDIAFINSLGYLLARDMAGAEAVFQLKGSDGKMDYRSAIIALDDSGIDSVAKLNGKSFAYTDPYSMAGYIMPLALMTEKKVKPSSTSFTESYSDVIKRVYTGDIGAGAIYYHEHDPYGRIRDARAKLVEKLPDLIKKVKIVTLTDTIPNTPVVFRKNLPQETKTKLVEAFQKIAEDPKDMTALGKMYDSTGFGPANEESFNKIQKILRTLGKEVKEAVPGGVTYYKKHLWDHVPEY